MDINTNLTFSHFVIGADGTIFGSARGADGRIFNFLIKGESVRTQVTNAEFRELPRDTAIQIGDIVSRDYSRAPVFRTNSITIS